MINHDEKRPALFLFMTTATVGIKVHKPGHVIITVCKQSLHVEMQYYM